MTHLSSYGWRDALSSGAARRTIHCSETNSRGCLGRPGLSLTPERRFGSVAQDNATVFGVNETVAMSEAQRESTGMGGFARFCVRLVAPYWRHILVVLLAMAPAVAYTAVYPLILQALIDQAIIPGQGAVAVSLITGLVALLVLTWLGDVLHQYLVARLVADAGNALRLRVFQHLQDLQVRAYARFEGGDILARCMAGAEAIEQALTLVFSNLLPQVATIIVGGAVLFWIEWRLALLCLALMPIVYIGPRIFGRRVEQASIERQSDAATLVGALQENLATQLVVKAFGLREVSRERFEAGTETVLAEQRAIRVLEQLARHHAVAEWCGAAGSVSERRIADGAPGHAFGGLTGGLLRASVVDGRRVPIAG